MAAKSTAWGSLSLIGAGNVAVAASKRRGTGTRFQPSTSTAAKIPEAEARAAEYKARYVRVFFKAQSHRAPLICPLPRASVPGIFSAFLQSLLFKQCAAAAMAEETKEAPPSCAACPAAPRARPQQPQARRRSLRRPGRHAGLAVQHRLVRLRVPDDSTISLVDDDADAEARRPAPARGEGFLAADGTAKSTPEEDVFDETTDLAANAEDEPLMRKS